MRRLRKRLFLLAGLVITAIFGAVIARNYIQNESASADSGSVTGYQQHTNGTTTIGLFQVNGSEAWCFEHDKTSPSIGTSMETLSGYPALITSSSSERDQLLFKIMYYGKAGGYGDIPIAMASSYVFTEQRSPSMLYSSLHETGNSLTATDLLNYATSAALPAGMNYLYLWYSPSNSALQILGQYAHTDGQTVTVTKIWKDNSNAYGTRPTSVRIYFYVNGVNQGYYDLTGSGNTWTQAITLGAAGTVTITEDAVSGYSTSISGLTVTNTLTGTTSISGTKIWKDNSNAYSTRPSSITLNILQNGAAYSTLVLSGSGDTWTGTKTGLPKYDANGVLYSYSLAEPAVSSYTSSRSGNTFTNTLTGTTSVSVTKIWKDNSNAYSTRPASIEIEILQNGSVYQTKTLSATGNTWSATYSGLPMYDANGVRYTYSVREKATPTGYTSSQSDSTITNTLTGTTSITVTKQWDDLSNADNTRPATITFNLLRNGTQIDTISLNGTSDTWSREITGLPLYDAEGVKYSYTVEEASVPTGYQMSRVDDLTIKNSYRGETSTTVTKVWSDWSNRHNYRPANVNVDLLRDGTKIKTVTLTGSGNTWTHTETGLLKYRDDGTEYQYTWRESSVPTNYTMTQSGNTITNKLDVRISLTLTKIWKDNHNAYNTRPSSIVVHLTRSDNSVMALNMTGSGDTWTLTVNNLEKYNSSGNEWGYSWSEDGDLIGVYDVMANGNTLTNTLIGTTEISMTKSWVDNSNAYNTRPTSVEFEIIQNGSNVYKTVTLSGSANEWNHTERNMPKYDSEGVLIEYTVREKTNVAGYRSAQSGNTVTNSLYALATVRGTKTWKDNSNAYNFRPTNITLKLYRSFDGSEEQQEVTATPTWTKDGNTWNYEFTNLPLYENGVKINYTVSEVVPENYKNTTSGYDFVNTLYGKVEINGTKTWKYNGAPDRARPDEITVNLLRNGVQYKSQTLTADNMTSSDEDEDTAVWEFSFTNLDKYDSNGVLYEYTIEELEVDQYVTEVSETDITNTYNPDLIDIHVDKIWLNDTEDDRPGKIEVELLRDGEVIDEVELNNETGWEYDWKDLDANYDYDVRESYQIPGYYPGVTTGDVENGFTIENKKIPKNPKTIDGLGAAGAVLAASTIAGVAITIRKRR